MSAPKSDTATVEARKHRLLELLTEGKTQKQAAKILPSEDFPANIRTVRRDVMSFKEQWAKLKVRQFETLAQATTKGKDAYV